MSTFEFIFSLFGLLIGFSLAELAGGFSRAYDGRKSMPIGWISPVLGALLIVDLLSFWYGAWFLRDMELKFWVVLVAAIVGLLYYFAATQVFPREGAHEAPTAHIMEHRKAILFSVPSPDLRPAWLKIVAEIQPDDQLRMIDCIRSDHNFYYAHIHNGAIVTKMYTVILDSENSGDA